MKHKAIVFDLDGTLVDTRADLASAVNHARGRAGLAPLGVATVTEYVGEGVGKLIERAFDRRHELVEAALRDFRAYYSEHFADASELYDGVAEGLGDLARLGARMAVLTNKSEGFARALLGHFGLTDCFCGVLGGDSLATRKPDPEGARRLVAEMGAAPAATLMVGDHFTDLATARNAGLRSVFCEYGFGRQEGEPCDFRVKRFAEVVEIFRRR